MPMHTRAVSGAGEADTASSARPLVTSRTGETAEVLPTLTKRRMSGQVYSTFQREFAKLGVQNVMPRAAFLLEVALYVRSLEDLVAACTTTISSSSAPSSSFAPSSASLPARAKAVVVAPALALWQHMPWQKTPRVAENAPQGAVRDTPDASCGRAATAGAQPGGEHKHSGSNSGAEQNGPPPPYSGSGARNLLRRLRQPLKVALSVVLASVGILLHHGPANAWAVVAVCQSLTSHPGSSFRSAWNRIQGTVLGGMAGIAALGWCGLTSPFAIVAFITVWTLFCCFSRRSSVYGEAAVTAALTAPVIMLGPVGGEQGVMLRVEQTVLGCLIYSLIDNLLYPVRAKLDLRRELVASLDAFRALWTSAFGVFFLGRGVGGGKEELAKAQASNARLTVRVHGGGNG